MKNGGWSGTSGGTRAGEVSDMIWIFLVVLLMWGIRAAFWIDSAPMMACTCLQATRSVAALKNFRAFLV